jgi:hypothetical protein
MVKTNLSDSKSYYLHLGSDIMTFMRLRRGII